MDHTERLAYRLMDFWAHERAECIDRFPGDHELERQELVQRILKANEQMELLKGIVERPEE